MTEAGSQWEGAERLTQAAAQADLACVCDVKEAGGDSYFRLNDRRVGYVCVCKLQQVYVCRTRVYL